LPQASRLPPELLPPEPLAPEPALVEAEAPDAEPPLPAVPAVVLSVPPPEDVEPPEPPQAPTIGSKMTKEIERRNMGASYRAPPPLCYPATVARESTLELGLAPGLEAAVAEVARRWGVLEAYVFGSVARGTAQPHSDLDVAVMPGATPLDALDLTADLMRATGRNDIDLVRLDRADPVLYHRVLTDGVRVYAVDLSATTTREGRALSRYCDDLHRQRIVAAAHHARVLAGQVGR
jgi:predicted nucleotidyltransferase